MKITLIALMGAGLLLGAGQASAHHSGAMFDHEKVVTLAGTIKELQWTNPHSWVEIYVPDAAGKQVLWSLEMEGPNVMNREGWNRTIIKPGDKVTIHGHPLKDGRPGGSLMDITLPNGKVLARGKPAV
jgi:hypothetical protein